MSDLFEQVAAIARNETDRLLQEQNDTRQTILGVKTELEWTFKDKQNVKLEDVLNEIKAMADKV